MTFYGNILITAKRVASYVKDGPRRNHNYALMYVGFSQFLLFAAGIMILERILSIDLFKYDFAMYILISVLIAWLIAVSYYYSLSRVDAVALEFEQKTDRQKTIWGIITILAAVIPIALIAILSPNHNP